MGQDLLSLLRAISASHGELRTDIVSYRALITASGVLGDTANDVTRQQLHDDYDYYITELRAVCTPAGLTDNVTNADAKFDDLQEIRFNFQVGGAGQTLFTADVELAPLVDVNGLSVPVRFDPGGYAVAAGKELRLLTSRRATTITTARVLTVQLIALMIPKDFHLAGEVAPNR